MAAPERYMSGCAGAFGEAEWRANAFGKVLRHY
jgi:hypothetical protein